MIKNSLLWGKNLLSLTKLIQMADKEIRIKSVPEHMKEQVQNVAKNTGVSESQMIKGVIRDWLIEIPDHYKKLRNFDD